MLHGMAKKPQKQKKKCQNLILGSGKMNDYEFLLCILFSVFKVKSSIKSSYKSTKEKKTGESDLRVEMTFLSM